MQIFSLLRKIILFPFSLIYLVFYLLDRSFKRLRRKKAQGMTVISVGNITTGGTGKTPLVRFLCDTLKKYKPVILTRGYASQSGPGIINRKMGGKMARFGDEPALLAQETGCDVSVDPDRYRGILKTGQKKGIFILDDGFQHYALDRDLDIVLLDATNPFGGRALLPAGNLREPVSALRRADIVIINRGSLIARKTLDKIINEVNSKGISREKIFLADMDSDGLTDSLGHPIPSSRLDRKAIFAFAGIGNFQSFRSLVTETFPSREIKFMSYPDHYSYSTRDIQSLQKRGKKALLLTTAKDGIKLKGRLDSFTILRTRIKIRDQKRFLKYLPFS